MAEDVATAEVVEGVGKAAETREVEGAARPPGMQHKWIKMPVPAAARVSQCQSRRVALTTCPWTRRTAILTRCTRCLMAPSCFEGEDDIKDIPAAERLRIGEGTLFHDLLGDMAIEDAMLEMFCRAAQLSEILFGDKANHSVRTTDLDTMHMSIEAVGLGNCIQVLYGPVNTTKLQRLMSHFLAELRGNGNLWEGDTSVNESIHKTCKRMYRRSNKRGPTLALQMMSCDETRGAILHAVFDEDSPEEDTGAHDDDLDTPTSPYDRFVASHVMGGAPKPRAPQLAELARSTRERPCRSSR